MKLRPLLLALLLVGCPPAADDDSPTPLPPSAPTAAVISVGPDGPRTGDDLVLNVDAAATDVDGDLAGERVAWFQDGVEQADLRGETTVLADRTARGQVWRVTHTAIDSGDREATAEATVTIVNTPPSVDGVTLGPEDPDTEALLVTTVSGWFDADGDPEAYAWSWTVDGVSPGSSDATLDGDAFARDQVVEVTVTPVDAIDGGEPRIASITILNSAPTSPSLFVAPTGAIGGQDPLICTVASASTDLDDDALTYLFSWTVDGAAYPASNAGWVGPSTTTWPGDTVPSEDSEPGQEWICSAVATDGTASSAPASATAGAGYDQVPDFSLIDLNTTSLTFNQAVSPRDYLQKVSGWYFGHAT